MNLGCYLLIGGFVYNLDDLDQERVGPGLGLGLDFETFLEFRSGLSLSLGYPIST